MFPLFTTGVVYISIANLPPLSTTLAKLVKKFAAGDVDTSGKFAVSVVHNALFQSQTGRL